MKVGEGMQEYCISVVIPVYNCEKHIHRCLKSVSSQDFEGKYEIIIVDDGSTDNTIDSCNRIISNMNISCKLIKQPNLGASAARNAGIRVAKGKYLIFVDGDDTLEVNALKILYQLANVNQVDMTFGSFRSLDESGKLLWSHRPGKKYYGKRSSYELLDAILMGKMLLRLGTFIIAKYCIQNNAVFFHEGCRYGEDMEFIIKCLLNVTQVFGTGAFIYNYFENAGSVMDKVGLERFEFVEALKRLETHLVKVKNKNRVLSDLLCQFFIPYGILFHIDTLLVKKIPTNEITNYLFNKSYDTLLQTACLSGTNTRIVWKARLWKYNPEIYSYRIHIYRKIKSMIKKVIRI